MVGIDIEDDLEDGRREKTGEVEEEEEAEAEAEEEEGHSPTCRTRGDILLNGLATGEGVTRNIDCC